MKGLIISAAAAASLLTSVVATAEIKTLNGKIQVPVENAIQAHTLFSAQLETTAGCVSDTFFSNGRGKQAATREGVVRIVLLDEFRNQVKVSLPVTLNISTERADGWYDNSTHEDLGINCELDTPIIIYLDNIKKLNQIYGRYTSSAHGLSSSSAGYGDATNENKVTMIDISENFIRNSNWTASAEIQVVQPSNGGSIEIEGYEKAEGKQKVTVQLDQLMDVELASPGN